MFLPFTLQHGTSAGNIVSFSNTQLQILGVGYGEFEGKRTFVMPYGAINKNVLAVS